MLNRRSGEKRRFGKYEDRLPEHVQALKGFVIVVAGEQIEGKHPQMGIESLLFFVRRRPFHA